MPPDPAAAPNWWTRTGREWADPGYFVGRSPLRNGARVLWHMVKPPRGHRTRMTRIGLLLVFISVGLGSAAFNTSHNMLYLALALLLSCLLLSGVLSWLNFKGARWRMRVEGHFRVGETAPVQVEVFNRNRYLPIYSLWFYLLAQKQDAGTTLPLLRPLGPQETRQLTWQLTPTQRGLETLGLHSIISKFPFGFLRKSIEWTQREEVEVWPARCRYSWTPAASSRHLRVGERQTRAGGGAELMNLRLYRPGDALRQVSWKATARQGRLMVRETAEESQARYWLEVGSSSRVWEPGPQFERYCSFVATLAEDLFQQGRLAGVILNDQPPQPVQHLPELQQVLSALSRLEPTEPPAPRDYPHQPRVTFGPGAGEQVRAYIHGQPAGEA
ncbi:MAG: DUF58 domain-containing protein [Verrucomicrobiota bacterium JB022]|nr:DUF58 domain-containing protein [Verrucomicrobiota bacterium JB022]